MPYTSPSTAIVSGSTTTNLEVPIAVSISPDTFKVASLADNPLFVPPGVSRRPVYRGFLAGQYVYSVGTAPVGAADVIIAGYRQV